MEVPFIHPMNQRTYHSPSSHYDDDDILSSSSYNIPVSNTSGSTITFEPNTSGRSTAGAPRQRVRDMVKMFEGSTTSAASTPVHRNDALVFTASKPYFPNAVRGNAANNFSGSQTSVKQYTSQFPEADDQGKRRTSSAVRGCFGVNPCTQHQQQQQSQQQQQHQPQQYQDTSDEQSSKPNDKCRRYPVSGCTVGTGYGAQQPNMKPYVQQQLPDGGEPAKVSERCQRCNVLCRCDEIHYCLRAKKHDSGRQDHSRISHRNEIDCNSGSNKTNNGLKWGPYSGFGENHNSDMLRSPTKELSESKTREPRRNPSDLYDEIDGIPVSLAYDSKTTILRTQDGVRIVVDISIDSMSSVSAADVICSRVETEMPHSRILTEFQQKSAMIMAGEDNRV